MFTMFRVLRNLVFPFVLALLTAAAAGHAQPGGAGDGSEPSGGGYGCVANGNCKNTAYKDSKVRSEWWYGFCSGCHGLDPNPRARRVASEELRSGTRDAPRFWTFHNASLSDAHWQRTLRQFRRPIDPSRLGTDFRQLLAERPRSQR